MANTVVVTAANDSPDLATIHVYLRGDGSGEESDVVIFDASVLSGANAAWNVWEIQGCLNGFTARVEYDQTTDFALAVLPADRFFDFKNHLEMKQHKLPNNPSGTGTTGDIVLTTTGLGNGDEGFIVLTVQKKRTSIPLA